MPCISFFFFLFFLSVSPLLDMGTGEGEGMADMKFAWKEETYTG